MFKYLLDLRFDKNCHLFEVLSCSASLSPPLFVPPLSFSPGPFTRRALRHGDSFSGSWWLSGASRWSTSWRPAGFSQPVPAGPAYLGPGCGGLEICPAWSSPPGYQKAFGGKTEIVELENELSLGLNLIVQGQNVGPKLEVVHTQSWTLVQNNSVFTLSRSQSTTCAFVLHTGSQRPQTADHGV